MANELAPRRAYVDAYAALQEGRQRALNEQKAIEEAQFKEASRAAAANAMRDGRVDPTLYGNELARLGYAYAVPGAQEELFKLEEQRGKSLEAVGKGTEAGEKGFLAKLNTFKKTLPNNPEGARRWMAAAYQDPEIGRYLGDFGSLEEAQAAIPDDAAKFGEWRKNAGLFVDEFLKEYTLSAKEEADVKTERMKPGPAPAQYNPEVKEVEDPNDSTKTILVDAKIWRGGGIGSPGVIGPKGKIRVPGQKPPPTVDVAPFKDVIKELRNAYSELDKLNAIPSTRRSAEENALISLQTGETGQEFGRIFGTKAQSQRNFIASARIRLLQGISKATGMSTQQLNSNVELQQWLNAVTNPATDLESNREILNSIENFVNQSQPKTTPSTPTGGGQKRQTSSGTSYQVIED